MMMTSRMVSTRSAFRWVPALPRTRAAQAWPRHAGAATGRGTSRRRPGCARSPVGPVGTPGQDAPRAHLHESRRPWPRRTRHASREARASRLSSDSSLLGAAMRVAAEGLPDRTHPGFRRPDLARRACRVGVHRATRRAGLKGPSMDPFPRASPDDPFRLAHPNGSPPGRNHDPEPSRSTAFDAARPRRHVEPAGSRRSGPRSTIAAAIRQVPMFDRRSQART
jgi:hypothetical protein